jgi:putative transport protein
VIDLLLANPLLLLFVVVAIGYPLGRLKVGGVSLGVAAVLFAGLAVGALHPDLKLPDVVYQLGAVVFVYTIGLASGRGFFGSLRRRGLRDNAFAVGVIGLAAVVAGTTALALGQRGTTAGGLFAGALNNTPALAAALD